MCGLGFPEMFVKWIMKCVKTVNYSIVVNGQISQSFEVAKRLRQGDPMSPFLFAIAMEYLSRILRVLRMIHNSSIILSALNLISLICVLQMIFYSLLEEILSLLKLSNCVSLNFLKLQGYKIISIKAQYIVKVFKWK